MKIAFFTDTYYPYINGVTVSLDNYTAELRRKGHTVFIFAPKVRGYKKREKGVIFLSSLKIVKAEPDVRMPLLIPDRSFQRIFKEHFDIIHAHGNGAFSFLGYEVARMKRIPYVLTFHTIHTKYMHYLMNGKLIKPAMVERGFKAIARLCDGVVAPSEKMRKELISYGIKKDIKVLPNFIDLGLFKNPEEGYLHKKLHLDEKIPLILTVGRLGKEKNFDFVIHAFKQLTKTNTTAHLVIVGQGLERENLEELVQMHNLSDRVHFTGKIEQEFMPSVYADAAVFVFASTTETQGVCVLEAAVAGCPIVVSDDAAYEMIVKDGINGYCLPLKTKEFAHKIEFLLSHPELAGKFAVKSHEMAEKYFNPEKITDELLAYYKVLIALPRRKRVTGVKIPYRTLLKLFKIAQIRELLNM